MEHAEIGKLMGALAQVHKEYGVTIGKDKKGHKGTYASLPCVLEAIHEMCSNHGLILYQGSCIIEGKEGLLSTLYHVESQQSISSVSLLTYNRDAQNVDQVWGGSSTYHRRYDAMMLMGIFCSDDPTDHDGNVKETPKKQTRASSSDISNISNLIRQVPHVEKEVLKTLNIAAITDVPHEEVKRVVGFLEKKIKEQVK